MTIVYSLIARGTTILCSHQSQSGSFTNVAKQMLGNIPTRNDTKITYTSESYKFHTLIENGIIYMCVAEAKYGARQPFAYLEEVKGLFLSGSLATRAQFAVDGELDRDFAQVMAGQMDRFSSGRGQPNDNLTALQQQVDDVKGVMSQNIEKVLERGERLEDLMDKTTDLEEHSNTFRKTARSVHKKMWWANMKMKICIGCTVFIVIFVIVLIILFATHVLPVKHGSSKTVTTTTPRPG